nr:unnamed protein product [Spirometra erinaceieuropaei]
MTMVAVGYSSPPGTERSDDVDPSCDLLEKCQARGETLEPFFELTNFQEACRAVNTAVTETKIPPDVAQIFDECPSSLPAEATFYTSNENVPSRTQHAPTATIPPGGSSSKTASSPLANLTMPTFWRLVAALRDFTLNEGDGCLPLRGDLPDMTSDSGRYLRLLSVFREHAEWAVSRLAARLSDVCSLLPHISLL